MERRLTLPGHTLSDPLFLTRSRWALNSWVQESIGVSLMVQSTLRASPVSAWGPEALSLQTQHMCCTTELHPKPCMLLCIKHKMEQKHHQSPIELTK